MSCASTPDTARPATRRSIRGGGHPAEPALSLWRYEILPQWLGTRRCAAGSSPAVSSAFVVARVLGFGAAPAFAAGYGRRIALAGRPPDVSRSHAGPPLAAATDRGPRVTPDADRRSLHQRRGHCSGGWHQRLARPCRGWSAATRSPEVRAMTPWVASRPSRHTSRPPVTPRNGWSGGKRRLFRRPNSSAP